MPKLKRINIFLLIAICTAHAYSMQTPTDQHNAQPDNEKRLANISHKKPTLTAFSHHLKNEFSIAVEITALTTVIPIISVELSRLMTHNAIHRIEENKIKLIANQLFASSDNSEINSYQFSAADSTNYTISDCCKIYLPRLGLLSSLGSCAWFTSCNNKTAQLIAVKTLLIFLWAIMVEANTTTQLAIVAASFGITWLACAIDAMHQHQKKANNII